MININKLKAQISSDDIIEIVTSLGAECRKQTNNELIFTSICHHRADAEMHKPKLYYYIDSQSFYCFSCSWNGDIIALVQLINNYTFTQAVKYICDILNINTGYLAQTSNPNKYDWKKDFLRYTQKNYKADCELTVYNDRILEFFENKYPLTWIEEGISIDVMQEYEIKYYPLHNSIVIPCRDEGGNLIGIRERFLDEENCVNGKYKPLCMLDGVQFNFPTNQMFYGINNNLENIKRKRTVWLVEGEKSVLKASTWFGDDNVALGMYGVNLGTNRRDFLLSLGIEEAVIMIDSDFQDVDGEEYGIFWRRVQSIADMLKGFVRVFVCYNNQGYDGYKFSPFDFTREQFETLYNEKVEVSNH